MLVPMTELEAVNLILSTIGEAPVNSLDTAGLADASLAKRMLDQASREVQSRGWHWNTEEKYPLSPDTNGFLVLPANTLRVDPYVIEYERDLVQRGDKLYDRKNHTFTFTDAVEVDITLLLPFEELPDAARNYIYIRAARSFQQRILGSQVLDAYSREDEFKAMALLMDAEMDTGDYNMLTDSWSVSRVLSRSLVVIEGS